MTALGAIFDRRGAPVSRDGLARMENALRVHAPGGIASRSFDTVGLVCGSDGRFTPQDARDRQPFAGSGSLAIAFSGFLTDRASLGEKLGLQGRELDQLPDSRLLAAAWSKWGRETFDHLNGDYAFIVADEANQRIYAARSPGRALPLFAYITGERVAIASAPKGLFALQDVPRELDEQRVADWLIANNQDAQHGFYRHLQSIPLGHCMEFGREGSTLARHFHPERAGPIRFARDEDYVERAREILDACVADTLRAANMPALSLSSGLDSTTVAASALRQLTDHPERQGRSLDCYTAVPREQWDGRAVGLGRIGDERPGVEAFAAMTPGITPHFVDNADSTIDRDWDKVIYLAETPPPADLNQHWVLGVMRAAQADGHNVLLTATMGNATLSFAADAIFAKWFREGKWARLLREHWASGAPFPSLRGLYPRAIRPNLPRPLVRRLARLRGDAVHQGITGHSPIAPDYARDMQVEERALALGWDTTGIAPDRDADARMDRLIKGGMRDMAQSGLFAIQSMTGVQMRDPMADRRLIEFCQGIPKDQFYRNGQNRFLLRRMMGGQLPDIVLNGSRGRQAADAHGRITDELPRWREEIERMADDPEMAARFDIPRLRQATATWPEKTPLSARDHPDYLFVLAGVSRAVATSRFINWVKGRN